MSARLVPPPAEPAADAVHAALTPEAVSGRPLGDLLGSPASGDAPRLARGGAALFSVSERDSAAPVARLAVRVANRPAVEGYHGAMSRGGVDGHRTIPVELRVGVTDAAGARVLGEAVLAAALEALLGSRLASDDAAVVLNGPVHLLEGPGAVLFDEADESWTAWAVVEVSARRV